MRLKNKKTAKMLITVLIIIPSLTILLTGCWDSIDIEDRAYVIGIAIDEYPQLPQGIKNKENIPENEQERMFESSTEVDTGVPSYAMTIQIPIIKHASLPNILSGGTSEPNTLKTWDITQVGNSFMEINSSITTRMNLIPNYEHLQVIIISEKVARKGLRNVLDLFIRDHEMRSRTKLFITDGDAKKALDVIPRIEDYASIYLTKMPRSARVNGEILHWMDLGQAVQAIYSGEDFELPALEVTEYEVMNKGAALFKNDKMVGWADGKDVEIIKIMHNVLLGGIFTSKFVSDEHDSENGVMSLEIIKSKTKITPVIHDDDITFKINVDIKGNYSDSVNHPLTEKIDKDFIEKAEEAFEESIKEQCIKTIKKMQDLGVDTFHFGTVIRSKKPSHWSKIKDRWDEIFPEVKTEVNVKVNIRQIGNIH